MSRHGVYPRTINPFQLTNILSLLSNKLVTCRGYSLILLLLQWARFIIGLINDVLFRAVRYGAALKFGTLGGCGHGFLKSQLSYTSVSQVTQSHWLSWMHQSKIPPGTLGLWHHTLSQAMDHRHGLLQSNQTKKKKSNSHNLPYDRLRFTWLMEGEIIFPVHFYGIILIYFYCKCPSLYLWNP